MIAIVLIRYIYIYRVVPFYLCYSLNKMHAMEGASGNGKNVDAAENAPNTSPKVPQSQQNGAALPEETATSPSALDYERGNLEKNTHDNIRIINKSLPITSTPVASTSQPKASSSRLVRSKSVEIVGKKRKFPCEQQDTKNGPTKPKKACCGHEERESSIKSLVGEEITADALEKKEGELFKQMQVSDLFLTHWGRITQSCVFTLTLVPTHYTFLSGVEYINSVLDSALQGM